MSQLGGLSSRPKLLAPTLTYQSLTPPNYTKFLLDLIPSVNSISGSLGRALEALFENLKSQSAIIVLTHKSCSRTFSLSRAS